MRALRFLPVALAGLFALAAVPASAGPPFLTDDPEPTDTGHWEIYAPQFETDGKGADFGGSFGAEINYGPVQDVQLTFDIPAVFAHDRAGWHWGAGDLATSIKYRFYNNQRAGLQIAVFPGVTLPTASNGLGAGRVTAFLPIWGQKDMGPWSVFGGGGYAINPGSGNRDYWSGGMAVTRQLGKGLLVGAEADQQGPNTVGGRASTSLGAGAIIDLKSPLRLLFSGGPTWAGHRAGYHVYGALGLNF